MNNLDTAQKSLSPWAFDDLTNMLATDNTLTGMIDHNWYGEWAYDGIIGYDDRGYERAVNYLTQYVETARENEDIPSLHIDHIEHILAQNNTEDSVREAIDQLSSELLIGLEILANQ